MSPPEMSPLRPVPAVPWTRKYLRVLVTADMAIAFLAGAAALPWRAEFQQHPGYWALTALVPLLWVTLVAAIGGYQRRFLGVSSQEYYAAARAALLLFVVLASASFIADSNLGRAYVLPMVIALLIGSVVLRRVMRGHVASQRSRGLCMQRTLLVGRADSVASLIESIAREPSQGLLPVAVCASGLPAEGTPTAINGVPLVGAPEDAATMALTHQIEVVVVASHPDLAGRKLRRLAWALEEINADLIVAPGLLGIAGPRMTIRPSAHFALVHVERRAAAGRAVNVKAIMDRVLAGVLLVLLSPVLALIALVIKVREGGPVVFRQQRVGERSEKFLMLKFRSMTVDAEDRLRDVVALDDGNGVLYKRHDDPRITSVGRWLRRYSLDELPQLVNVLRGEMSLVGPRPPLVSEVEQYEPDALRRLRVKPGMTGLWQVSGRSDLSWEDALRLDLSYVDNWSPLVDLRIAMKTVSAMLRGSGAY